MYHDPEYKGKVILRQVETGNTEKLIDFKGKVTTQRDLASRYRAWTVPTIILFDSKGQELNRIVGLLTSDYYLAHLDSAIDEAQARIKSATK
jgi:thioredoxin-related protein